MENFKKYLEFNNGEYKEKQEKIVDKIKLEKKDATLYRKSKLKVIAEPFCPDCRGVVAILENIRRLNEDKLSIEYVARGDSKEFKIPSIIRDDEFIFVEFPEHLKETLKDPDKLYEYRTGKYNDEILQELIKILK